MSGQHLPRWPWQKIAVHVIVVTPGLGDLLVPVASGCHELAGIGLEPADVLVVSLARVLGTVDGAKEHSSLHLLNLIETRLIERNGHAVAFNLKVSAEMLDEPHPAHCNAGRRRPLVW